MKNQLYVGLFLTMLCTILFSSCDREAINQSPAETTAVCNHSFGDWIVLKDATCKEDGQMLRICDLCAMQCMKY